MTSLPRTLLRPARHVLARSRVTPRIYGIMNMNMTMRGMANSIGDGPPREMSVGELEGADFKIEPLRRVGEDEKTMRARLVCMYLFIYLFRPLFFLFASTFFKKIKIKR